MSDPWSPIGDDELGQALRDLGAHLDLGPGDTEAGRAALVTAVLDRLGERDDLDDRVVRPLDGARRRRPPRRRARLVLVAAAVVVAVLAALLAVTPTREAIARWLGIGGVRITRSDAEAPDGPDPAPGAPGDTSTTGSASGSVDLAALGRSLPFPIRVIDGGGAGELREAVVDPTIPIGLVELRYDDVTLVEVASLPDSPPILGKVLPPGTEMTWVTVGDRPAVWLTGDTHEVATLDPDGDVRLDTVRRAGDVLLWEDDGVTYRIEGAPSLDAALELAAAVR